MKGIILSGGLGTRLHPLTISTSKQLLPVYDKPLIYYSLTTLMSIGIREILIITNKDQVRNFKKLLNNGKNLGIKINYMYQSKPNGIAESFIIGEKFIKNDSVALILGDNFFYGIGLNKNFAKEYKDINGALIFTYSVPNPNNFGVVVIKDKKIIKIVEKPKKYIGSSIVTGLYIYDNQVVNYAKKLKPSRRKELEITDLNNIYLKKNKLNFKNLSDGSVWLDTGEIDSLYNASQYIKIIQERNQILVGSPEIQSYKNGWIDKKDLIKSLKLKNDQYSNKILKFI